MNEVILLKELDLIDQTISRLDTQIQTTKTICITLWTAWLGWFISETLKPENDPSTRYIIMISAVFPLVFWFIDFQYRKALLSTSKRQSILSLFLNSEIGEKHLQDGEETDFPQLDPVGWLYKYNIEKLLKHCKYDLQPLKRKRLKQKITWITVLRYKEAKWFYFFLIVISILLGIFIKTVI